MLARASNQYQRILELHETWGLPTGAPRGTAYAPFAQRSDFGCSETAATFARSCAEYIDHLVQVRELSGWSKVNILDRNILIFGLNASFRTSKQTVASFRRVESLDQQQYVVVHAPLEPPWWPVLERVRQEPRRIESPIG